MSTSPGSQKPDKNRTSPIEKPAKSVDPWSGDADSRADRTAASFGGSKKWIGLLIAVVLNLAAFSILGFFAYKILGSNVDKEGAGSAATQPSGAGNGNRGAGTGVVSLPSENPRFFVIKDAAKRQAHEAQKIKGKVFSSIAEGLREAGAGAILEILDQEVYEEVIVHGRGTTQRTTANVRIVAEKGPDGRTAVLRLPKDAPAGTPLVQLDRAEGFQIRGLTLDGQGRCEDLIVVSGNGASAYAGVLLEDMQLQGYQRSAVKLVNTSSQGEYGLVVPLWLRDLRIEAPAAGKAGPADLAAVTLQGDNHHVHIQRCRFIGPFAAAIRLEGSVYQCEMDHNVFFGTRRAVVFGREPAGSQNGQGATFEVNLSNNTFCKCEHSMVFQQAPAAGSAVVMNNNIFFQIGQGITSTSAPAINDQLAEVVHGENNARDPKSQLGLQNLAKLQTTEVSFELPTERDKSSTWLRYSLNSPLAKAGKNGAFVGAFLPLVKD